MDHLENADTLELDNQGQENTQLNKGFSQEEVDTLLQREADRRVSAALAKQKKEYDKKLSLVNLDETQRAQAEKDMRIQELQEQLKGYAIEKNKSELKTVLGSRGLSPQFADLIEIGDDISEGQERIDALDKLFKQAVAEEVKKRLAGGVPRNGNNTNELNKETFSKMSLSEKNDLYRTNPDLWGKYTNQ